MNIGINCCHLSDTNDGAKTRIVNIYSVLIKLRKKDNFIFFVPKNLNLKIFSKNLNFKNVKFIKLDILSTQIFQRFFLGFFYWPEALKNLKIHYFDHSYLPLLIFGKKKSKIILTIHDLRYLNYWKNDFWRFLIFRSVLYISLKNCDKLITVSNTVKSKLSIFYRKPINLIFNFINTESKKKHITKSKQFIFSIGHFEKRKNFENLIKAFTIVKSNGYKGDLILCTNQGRNFDKIKKLIIDNPYSNNIKLHKNKNDEFVKKLYQSTELFVMPSIYEGFGIPILEAARYQKPILLSNIKVFKEITLNKSIYFNPYDISDISRKIVYVLQNYKEQKRLKNITKLVNKKYSGDKIIKKFSKLIK